MYNSSEQQRHNYCVYNFQQQNLNYTFSLKLAILVWDKISDEGINFSEVNLIYDECRH